MSIKNVIKGFRDGLPDWLDLPAFDLDLDDLMVAREERWKLNHRDLPEIIARAEKSAGGQTVTRVDALAPVINMYDAAKSIRYKSGRKRLIRTRFPPRDLSKFRVLIMLHQTGSEKSLRAWGMRAKHVVGHTVILPDAHRARLHPANIRLVAGNRLDRAPFHTIHIEVAGNFEGDEGAGNWWKPEKFGYGEPTEMQVFAAREEVRYYTEEIVPALGGKVIGCVSHRISGVNRKGKPNRNLCCGWRLHGGVVEWSGAELGLAVPASDCTFGGLDVSSWHGPWFEHCDLLLKSDGSVVPNLEAAA